MICCVSDGEKPVVFKYSIGAGSRQKWDLVCAVHDLGPGVGEVMAPCCSRSKSREGLQSTGFDEILVQRVGCTIGEIDWVVLASRKSIWDQGEGKGIHPLLVLCNDNISLKYLP